MDRIVADLDRQFPGIAGAIVHREMSTSETFQHYLNTPGGSLYGFAPESRGFMPLAATAINGRLPLRFCLHVVVSCAFLCVAGAVVIFTNALASTPTHCDESSDSLQSHLPN